MRSYIQIALSLLTPLVVYLGCQLVLAVFKFWTSPINVLPGPRNPSLVWGNMLEIREADISVKHEEWTNLYGPTIRYTGFFATSRLYTVDVKALNHILMNNHIYQKPESIRYNLSRILGNGVLVVEEGKHKQQRKIMNPAFGAAQIRELTDIFIAKAIQLRDIWASESSKHGANGRVEVLSWLSRMTLDVIGIAGFNYEFDAMSTDPKTNKNELNEAFSTIFRSGTRVSLVPIIRGLVPALRFLPAENDAEAKVASKTMTRIGNQLLKDSKAALLAEDGKIEMEKTSFKRRDLLTLLLKANMSTDLPESQRMSDEDVLAQVPTFLVAGHETTSTATTWALYHLTQCTEAQRKLRSELLTVSTDNPTMDVLNSLPYLDMVVRECLRLTPPVPATMRIAQRDDIVPFSKPVKDKSGNLLDNIRITKGQMVVIPILALNRSKSIWGDNAFEFIPERWNHIPEAVGSIPGVWGNMMTFLGGPRACIGYRFALIEMKALLFTLLRAFEFDLAVDPSEIIKKSTIVQRPLLKSDPKAGNQMPLVLKPVRA